MHILPKRAVAGVAISAALAMPLLAPQSAYAGPCGDSAAGFRPSAFFGGGGPSAPPSEGPDQTRNGARSQIVEWLTGPKSKQASGLSIGGTDLGIMWDNGHEGPNRQVLMMFGDTFSCQGGNGHRSNVMFRSNDNKLDDGITFPGNAFGYPQGGVPIANERVDFARKMVLSLPVGVPEITVIPTAGISVDGIQIVNFMSVREWGQPGSWTTNFSALAISYDNGETFTSLPQTMRPNRVMGGAGPTGYQPGNENFQMGAVLKHDGFVYSYGTPQGRQGAAYLARVPEAKIIELDAYEYWDGAKWVPKDPAAARPVIAAPMSEMSVMWNDYLNKFISLSFAGGSVHLRTAEKPEGPWSEPRSILDAGQLPGNFYAPYIHPWSSGPDLYYTLSLWSTYNVVLMKTTLEK